MTYGLIGAGSIGRRHLDTLLKLKVPAGDIIVHDVDQATLDALTSEHRVTTTNSFSFFQQRKPDVVLVCTPAATHVAVALECLDVGLAQRGFFIEKPFALKATDAIRIKNAASSLSTTMVACNWRFHPEAKQFVGQASPGRYVAHMWCYQDMETWPGSNYATALFEGVHEIDLAMEIFPGTARLLSSRVTDRVAFLQFDVETTSGGYVALTVDLDFNRDMPSRGMLFSRGGSVSCYHWSTSPKVLDMMYREQMKHFLSAVKKRQSTCNSFADAVMVSNVCEAAQKFARI